MPGAEYIAVDPALLDEGCIVIEDEEVDGIDELEVPEIGKGVRLHDRKLHPATLTSASLIRAMSSGSKSRWNGSPSRRSESWSVAPRFPARRQWAKAACRCS